MKLAAAVRLVMTTAISSSALSFVALAELPVPCGSCSNAGQPVFFYSPNLAQPPVDAPTVNGNTMRVVQRADKALLNWETFNISRDAAVVFQQSGADSIALNRVWDPSDNPSLILGRLSANGQIYLINRNGIVFGEGAQVNVHSLVASSLDVADDVIEQGVFAPLLDGRPAFALTQRLDADGNPMPAGSIEVDSGARLASAENGRIMLLAPDVANRGTIETSDGQAILAAGERVWIADSDDEDLRGFIVEVDAGGTARNLGSILVDRGNASLVGLAVNQEGRVSARTSVSLDGSIRLIARDTVDINQTLATGSLAMQRSGALVFGEDSVTEVLPDYGDATTAIDEQTQPTSTVEAFGKTIEVGEAARVTATSGLIDFVASTTPAQPLTGETAGNGARIDIAASATLDVSGSEDVALAMERNVLAVELRGNELKDAPVQRNSMLNGKVIRVDVREGTPLADISGALANIQRGIGERTTAGGAITLRSEDALSIAAGATLDVSGGSVRYDSGLVDTTKLVSGGRIYDIADADPNLAYDAILGSHEATSAKWGVTNVYQQLTGTREAGYVEGKDAGSMTLLGSTMVIAGDLKGETVTGMKQRQLPASVALPWNRPAGELPLGGQVVLGDAGQLSATAGTANFRLPGVIFRSAGNAPDDGGMLVLDPAQFEAGGIARVSVYSDGRIVLPEDERIALAPGGALTLVAGSVTDINEDGSIATALQIDGDISLPAGDLVLRTIQNAAVGDAAQQDLHHVLAIGADAELDVSGRWVNDTPAVAPSLPDDAIAIAGGSIRVISAGGVDIADGANLRLNGGAWLDRGGGLNAGAGGDLTIGSTLSAAVPTLHLGGKAESYGLSEGGAMGVTAGGIAIAETNEPGINGGIWSLDPSYFQQGGFSSYNLTATHLGLSVEEGTMLEPRMLNWVLDADMIAEPTGAPFGSLARLDELPDYLRAPVHLSLGSRRGAGGADGGAGLTLAADAAINADAGANVSLRSDNSLIVAGTVRAPAGQISISLDSNSGMDPGLVTDKAIWLGADAVLAAPATARLTPDPQDLRRGVVLDGGRVTLQAERGFVVTDPGSLIDVSGVSATLDIARSSAAGTVYEAMEVAGDAGAIEMQASEGMILAGRLQVQAAATPGAAGGVLSVTLDTSDPLPDLQQGEFKFPTGAREIALLAGEPAALLGDRQPGDDLFSAEDLAELLTVNNGVDSIAAVSLQRLQASGPDAVDLKARPVVRNGVALDDARIRLDAGAVLQARGRVTLDAPILAGSGGDARVDAAHIALGPTDTVLRYSVAPASGAGTFTARADLIDLTGDLAVQGYGVQDLAAVSLVSRGDVRLTGLRIPVTESAQATGSLKTVNDLRIDAAQVYPTSLSEFTLEATGAESTVSLDSSGTGADGAVPMSAGGVLNVSAAQIDILGTVRAPHGRITLEAADRLTLAAGSEVSVAGPLTPVPYGQTQFGIDWVLPYDQSLLRVLGGLGDQDWSVGLPGKVVELVAENVELAAGAEVVLDGGGDLYAWEFIPGPGGSTDVLLPGNAQGAFAVLSAAKLSSAPLDPFNQYDGLEVGDSIELANGVDGLPAGSYALLPARYALLPGAFLLTPQAGMTGLAATDRFTTANGLPVVAARRGSALAGSHDSLWSGYRVESGAQVRQRAEYRESIASEFFADAASTSARLPADAGRLVIDAGARLSTGAAVQAVGAGRGGQVDIVADDLAVVDALTGQAGRVELLADGLAQLRVESLLLGGRREQAGDGVRIEADAESVAIESGVELELPEIILVAAADGKEDAGTIRVAAGASIRAVAAESATPVTYLTEGDSALLRVSSGNATEVERSDVPAETNAHLLLESGSALAAGVSGAAGLTGGSITMDSSGNAVSSAALTLGTGGALQLAASRISLGKLPAAGVTQGLALSQEDLAGLDVSNLYVRSASSIDLFGNLDLDVDGTLAFNAPVLRGIAAGDRLDAVLRAGTLTWQDAGSSLETAPAAELNGQLTFAAETVQLGDGSDAADLAVQGFTLTRIEGASNVVVQGDGELQVAGELQLVAPWLTTMDGADWHVVAGDSLAVLPATAGDAAPPPDAGLGSRLELAGSQVRVEGRMLLPAGQIELHASGFSAQGAGVLLAAGARIDVAGLQENFLDQTVVTPGGSIALIADQGDVIMEAGAGIDVSGDGGNLAVRAQGVAAIDGVLVADTLDGDTGSITLKAQSLGDFSALNDALNAGGFGEARHFRLKSGDVTIGVDEAVQARDVAIVLDGEPSVGQDVATGTFILEGTINAAGVSAGAVRIYARGDVELGADARIDAHASEADRAGGKVELATVDGALSVDEGAIIDVRGTREISYETAAQVPVTIQDTGQVRYRAPRASLLDADAQHPSLGGSVLGARRVELEAVQVYTDADGRIEAVDVAPGAANVLYQDAVDLMAREADIRAMLGVTGDPFFHLVPGIEIRSPGDLTLASAWDLAPWRVGANGASGALSLRAGGNITIEQSLSDGVERTIDPVFFTEKDTLLDDASWSLRLAAGADLVSIDPLEVGAGAGDLTLAAGALLRTGTGDVEVRAGRDVVLSDTASVIYTTGIDAGNGTLDQTLVSLYLDGVYPVLGGDVDIRAGRNVEAIASDQLINDWLFRIGGPVSGVGELPHAWNVSLTSFRQGVAAFGGGNVRVAAGGDVRNLSASVPTTGHQVGVNSFDGSLFEVESDEVVVQGGDSLAVRAGGDIIGGVYYLGRGAGDLTAGGAITRQDGSGLYTILGLGAGQWQATAGQQAVVETVFNPTLVNQALQQGFVPTLGSSFATYADSSALHLAALAGEARVNQNLDAIQNHPFLASQAVDSAQLKRFALYPGSLQAISFRDDVVINRSLDLIASPAGQLAFYADGSVRAEPNASPTVTMLDVQDAAPIHADDPVPARIVARHGDIGGEILNFNLAKSARLDAGGDIRNVRLDVQHLRDQDITVLNAAGSIEHDTTRAASGILGSSNLAYRVAGPGRVEFMAGGAVDLGTADGILTTGNTNNPFLSENGAAVTVAAGLRGEPSFDDFIDAYLAAGSEYTAALSSYLEDYATDPSLIDLENFRALPLVQQRPFLWQVFFSELRASGVAATTSGSEDYSRGFAAIGTLFPEQLYAGKETGRDLSLLLSRITTLDGGDINIVVPGGAANAGVATTSALIKQPSELGIVVQGSGDVNAFVRNDFAVNQSRVFTLDGGDLLMWSSFGDIDAGRGAKSAIAAPPPRVTTDPATGNTVITFPPAIAGSGIRAVVTTEGVEPGDVYLFAPSGVVSAGDAGIGSEGNVTIGAVEVIGADNIDVGGVSVGVPVADTGSMAAGLTGVSNVASAATKSSEESMGGGAASAEDSSATPLADAAFAVLDVVVLGFGEENKAEEEEDEEE